jgi:LPS sulfotransferase NodH
VTSWRERITRINLELRRMGHRLRLFRRWWLEPHRPYTPLFVLASFRCGSNLLVDYLNQLPGVACRGEVLCPSLPIGPRQSGLHPLAASRHIKFSLQGLKTPVRGCKLMLDQLDACRLTIHAIDAAFPGAKYVVLYRQSLADQFVSFKTALTTRQWVRRAGQPPKHTAVTVDQAELRAYCDRMQGAYRELLGQAWLEPRTVLLSYEELIAQPSYWLGQQIGPLLGVSGVQPVTRLWKQGIQPLQQRIENYRDVAALLESRLCRQHYTFHQSPDRRSA